jgi:hypothetical protein
MASAEATISFGLDQEEDEKTIKPYYFMLLL